MGAKITLDQLKHVLFQPNTALKKRALAIVFNEASLEALPLIEEYVGHESDAELTALGLKVLKKLQGLNQQHPKETSVEHLLSKMNHPDQEVRRQNLRLLTQCRSPKIPPVIHERCQQETDPEMLMLLADVLKKNPHIGNLGFLMRFSQHTSERVRLDALEGMLNVMFGCLYPFILKALLDPSGPMKMKAYQLIGNLSRANLLEALGYMFDQGNTQFSRMAGQLLPSFLGSDLLPLLKKNMNHPDLETSGLCRRAATLMAQKGFHEATALLEALIDGPQGTPDRPKHSVVIPNDLRLLMNGLPPWLVEPLRIRAGDLHEVLNGIREVYQRVCDFLVLSFICAYFQGGQRQESLDQTCFRALTTGIPRTDPKTFLLNLAPALPHPKETGDLFPMVLGRRISEAEIEDTIIDDIMSMQEGFTLIDDNPNALEQLLEPALVGLEKLLYSLAPIRGNRLIIRYSNSEGVFAGDFFTAEPTKVDSKTLVNFELPMNRPMLLNQTSTKALGLWPFLIFNPYQKKLVRMDPNEQDLWEFLVQNSILERFMAFLKQKPL